MAELAGRSSRGAERAEAGGAPDGAICLVSHPLLEDVRCQRLQGHPGTHGAEVETNSAEIYLEWVDDGPPE